MQGTIYLKSTGTMNYNDLNKNILEDFEYFSNFVSVTDNLV